MYQKPSKSLPKGRGATSNRASRFERQQSVAIEDGWGSAIDTDTPMLRTKLIPENTRKIITRNQSPDVPFDRSINPYKGCEHGCVYCFARPTHAYLGLSPGLDFESQIFYKPGAAALLEKELRSPKYKCAVLAMGTNTDPYQPAERELLITRRILEILSAHNHPVEIVTKSNLVTRDLDILGPMGRKGLAQVSLSVTTLNRELARKLEPRCATPMRRLETIRACADAGIQTGVMAAPMIPVLNDPELELILQAASDKGATIAGYILLRLPLEIKALFREWLETHASLKVDHVLNAVRGTRNGQMYVSKFGERMHGTGAYSTLLQQRFDKTCRRLGLNQQRCKLRTDLFKRPTQPKDQPSLFDQM